MNTTDITYEVTFTASTGYTIPMAEKEDAEEFLKEWIAETYPEFYDVAITEMKEVN